MQCRGCGVAAGANGGANSRLNWLVRGCGRDIWGLGPAQLRAMMERTARASRVAASSSVSSASPSTAFSMIRRRPSLLLGGSQDRTSGSVSSSATSAASGAEVAAQGSGNPNRKVIVISGMTGMGKSTLSLNLAKRLDGEIINADALQVYRGLDVGTDKLPISTRESVPHHLFCWCNSDQDALSAPCACCGAYAPLSSPWHSAWPFDMPRVVPMNVWSQRW